MGSHSTITSFVFQSRIYPRGREPCQVQMPGSAGQSHSQQLPLAAHTAEQLPAGTDSRHSCLEELSEHRTFQGRKISGTIPG